MTILLAAAVADPTSVPWPQIGIGSGWLFVGLFVWLVYNGRLVPRSTHDDALHDRDEWRTESRLKDAQIHEKDDQLRHLAEVGELVKAVLLAVRNAQRTGGGDA